MGGAGWWSEVGGREGTHGKAQGLRRVAQAVDRGGSLGQVLPCSCSRPHVRDRFSRQRRGVQMISDLFGGEIVNSG